VGTAESDGRPRLRALTAIPGSSRWCRGGLVVLRQDLKSSLAGVSASCWRTRTVYPEVAAELPRGPGSVRRDVGLGLTGVAGRIRRTVSSQAPCTSGWPDRVSLCAFITVSGDRRRSGGGGTHGADLLANAVGNISTVHPFPWRTRT